MCPKQKSEIRFFLVAFDLFLSLFASFAKYCSFAFEENKFRRIKNESNVNVRKSVRCFFIFRCVSSGNRNDLSINIKLVKISDVLKLRIEKYGKNMLFLCINIDTHMFAFQHWTIVNDWVYSLSWLVHWCFLLCVVWLRNCCFGDNLHYTHSCAIRCMHMHAWAWRAIASLITSWNRKRKAHIECKSRSTNTTDHQNRSGPSESSP